FRIAASESKDSKNAARCELPARSTRGSGERSAPSRKTPFGRPGSVEWHGTPVRAVGLRTVLMAVPGGTLRRAGGPLHDAQKIAGVFQADGYTAASLSGEFPIRLRSGSHALDMLGFSSEFLFPLLAIPGVRKRVVPTEVRIRCLGEDARETTLRVETRARGG